MIKIVDKFKCCGCYGCSTICPKQCIKFRIDEEGFWYPVCREEECINCGLCEKVCPILSKKGMIEKKLPIAYAAISKDFDTRIMSSSGGIFSVLAEYVLEQGGIVFGAALNEKLKVEHIKVEKLKDLYRLRGSKYVQSKLGDTYRQVKKYLTDGELVLFTGTPCQVVGLKRYLMKEYDNLICQDIICHGVPSPMVWKQYIKWQEKYNNKKIKKVNFRNKSFGWKDFGLSVEFEDGSIKLKKHYKDLFMQAFLKNYCLRPSCYQCNFKTINREADITLADLWGSSNFNLSLDEENGISLVIVHSLKGEEVLKKVLNRLQLQKIDIKESIKYNSAMVHSADKPENRVDFMKDIIGLNFDVVINKYCKVSVVKKIKKRLLGALHR